MASTERDAKVCRLHTRMTDVAVATWTHPDAARLAKRLLKDGESLLTFAEFPAVPSTNTAAEREIRPAVLMRKASYGSASEAGAATRAIWMSIHRTLKARGIDPFAAMRTAWKTLLETGTLPPLPDTNSSGG
jgi:transposase